MMPRLPEPTLLLLTLLLSSGARADAGTAWPSQQLVGQCFANAQEVIQTMFGASDAEDENIKLSPVRTLTDGSVWLVDQTAGTNYQWYLLQPGEDKHTCLTLFVPAAAQVVLEQRGTTQTATATTQASPGAPVKQARYQKRKGERSFTPTSCLKIEYTDNKRTSRHKVPCSTLFDD